jgi:DNA helicase-2/ATP-dependent DNA helicase PcrA
LWEFYGQDGLTGEGRKENLEELVNAAAQYRISEDTPEDLVNEDPLLLFLAQTALDAGEIHEEGTQDKVNLMTIHAAKGLEFGFVTVAGLEERIFPLSRALEDPTGLEEERRLMYVAMTRARRQLLLSSCGMRRFHGKEELMQPSRFLSEIPKEMLKKVGGVSSHTAYTHTPNRYRTGTIQAQTEKATVDAPFPKRCKVIHARFGEGVVLATDGMGEDGRVQVRFSDATRWLMLSIAKLEKTG